MQNFNFPEPWLDALGRGFCDEIFADLAPRINALIQNDVMIFPPIDRLFHALDLTSFWRSK